MTGTPVFIQSPYNPTGDIVNANGVTQQTIITSPAASGTSPGGCKLSCVRLLSDDSSSRVVQFWYNDRPIGQVTIPANSGVSAAAVDLFSQSLFTTLPYDALGNKYLQMSPGDTLKWNLVSGSVTSGKKLTFLTLVGGKF